MIKNKISTATIGFLLLTCMVCANHQIGKGLMEIQVTTTKTTNLVFEYRIMSIDRGSDALLAQRAHMVENVLQLKAKETTIEPTNLTVVTSDGKLHCLQVNYHPQPAQLVYYIEPTQRWLAQFENGFSNEQKLQRNIKKALARNKDKVLKKQHKTGITFALQAIYSSAEFLWYHFTIRNSSTTNYPIANIRFFIIDHKKVKRSTFQEIELFPIHSYLDLNQIPSSSTIHSMHVLPLQILPKGKQLSVQLMDTNGSRPLELKINNKLLMNALPIKD